MDFLKSLAEIVEAQDTLEELNDKVRSYAYQSKVEADVEELKTVSEGLKSLGPWILLDLQSYRLTEDESPTLPLSFSDQESFIRQFNQLITLKENADQNLSNENWINSLDRKKASEDLKKLESRLLRVEADVSQKFYDLENKYPRKN